MHHKNARRKNSNLCNAWKKASSVCRSLFFVCWVGSRWKFYDFVKLGECFCCKGAWMRFCCMRYFIFEWNSVKVFSVHHLKIWKHRQLLSASLRCVFSSAKLRKFLLFSRFKSFSYFNNLKVRKNFPLLSTQLTQKIKWDSSSQRIVSVENHIFETIFCVPEASRSGWILWKLLQHFTKSRSEFLFFLLLFVMCFFEIGWKWK